MTGAPQPTLQKAWKALSALAALVGAACVGAALAWNAGLFNSADALAAAAAREAAARRTEQMAFTEVYLRREARELRMERNETLAGLMARAGASQREASAVINSISSVYNPRRMRPGQPVNLYFERADDAAHLTGVAFRSDPGASITANRMAEGGFAARQVLMPVTYEIARIAAPVRNSLYESALELGATDHEIDALADAFGYDVDFQRDIQRGDQFELVFERFYDDEGHTVRTGDLLFIALDVHGEPRRFYSFQAPGDSHPDWYDSEGKSARRFLMKTPINGARLASGFGMRLHPILGYSLIHRGTDFAAPIGTPIMAAGDGVVERAGGFGTYGNYIRIRHGDRYETAYAHLSRFGAGIRTGARVRQGQIIGYVGATGRSTGPHLHYEVLLNGSQVNPMGLRVPTGRNLSGRDLQLFQGERARIDTLREERAREGASTIDAVLPGRRR
ncbi:MAG TPA: M23 family metallopeptidase [Caulobacterales bacterium]|nr:M23 family metallopeptidase [Caulobacterales bacterium]